LAPSKLLPMRGLWSNGYPTGAPALLTSVSSSAASPLFLNALVGDSVLPAGVVPVTAVPTIVRYGRRAAARVRFEAGEWTAIPVKTVDEPEVRKRLHEVARIAEQALAVLTETEIGKEGREQAAGNNVTVSSRIPRAELLPRPSGLRVCRRVMA
jgi:hypothetical protein